MAQSSRANRNRETCRASTSLLGTMMSTDPIALSLAFPGRSADVFPAGDSCWQAGQAEALREWNHVPTLICTACWIPDVLDADKVGLRGNGVWELFKSSMTSTSLRLVCFQLLVLAFSSSSSSSKPSGTLPTSVFGSRRTEAQKISA